MTTITPPIQQTLPTPGPVTLDLSLATGEALVRAELPASAGTESVVTVEACDPDDPTAVALAAQVRARLVGDQLQVHVPTRGSWRRNPPIRIRVQVPLDSLLTGATAAARIDIAGRLRGLQLRTASGRVDAEQITGDVTLSTASGDIRVAAVGGSARLRSASGALTVTAAEGSISVKSASGSVRVDTAGADLDVATASGHVLVGSVGAGRVRVHSGSGGIRLGVRAGTAVHFDVLSGSGSVHSTLQPEPTPTPGEQVLELRIRTGSGQVQIGPAQT